jgi:2-amino-4-hydroxy-6-hydroxymethyldihydropteridine diphosphokinase
VLALKFLIDANVLLRIFRQDDPQYQLIAEALDELDDRGAESCFSLQNIAEFWNVCTRPKERNGYGLSIADTNECVEYIEHTMTYLPDSQQVYSIWRDLVITRNVRGVQVHDARLAAIMRAYGVTRILTLNESDFSATPAFRPFIPIKCALRRDSLNNMHTAYIGMGANLPSAVGTPQATLAAAAARLESIGRVRRRSSLYSTEPVGFAEQPRFINAVVQLETNLDPRDLLQGLLSIEQEFGRDRTAGFANGPRTLDLDILLYDDRKISERNDERGLQIPHPRLAERAFVLVPLCEIAPRIVAAEGGTTVSQLLDRLRKNAGNETDAVVPIQSDGWRAGACGDGPRAGAY